MEIPYRAAKEQYPYRVTAKIRGAFSTGDQPNSILANWQGYFRNTDKTILPPNTLTFPSINCFIPNKDRIVPRLGTTQLGQAFTNAWPAIGHKKRFATMGGIEVEVRVNKSDDTNLKDIITVLYPNPVSGFLQWYQITENVNPLPVGLHRYYMDDWFDTNLNPAKSLNLSRLIWVNGLAQIFSWTGGIAVIGSLVTNTSITTVGGVTWASLGFVDPAIDPSSSGNIIVNGVKYVITGGYATDTLTLTNTSGISVNDIATSEIQMASAPVGFDSCRQNKNYMFYGSWNSRRYFMSNGFSHDATQEITAVQAFQNDLVLDQSSQYTGTGSHIYRVTIDGVFPAINTNDQIFVGTTGANGSYFDTTAYSGGTAQHIYRIAIIADSVLTLVAGAGVFSDGEGLVCTNGGVVTATLKVVAGGNLAGGALITQTISGTVSPGDTVTGTSTGTVRTCLAFLYHNSAQFFKDNIQIVGLPGMFNDGIIFGVIQMALPQTFNLIDGLTFVNSQIGGNTAGDYYQLTIQKQPASPDTFQWQIDGGTPVATGVSITGGNQTLNDGIQISFVNTTGHALGDYWDITVNQAVTQAWTSFYYTLPVRKPGEGYIYQLPSNFWTHAPQEEQMYVNTKYGYWSYVTTQLSADLQSEAVSLTPLKQASSSKVIFPYMISYLEDYIIYVTENKKLDMIGRQKLLQLPQTRSLSQPVAQDFLEASFEDGSMEYLDQRLWLTSPKDDVMFCYDNQPLNKYWQPPQVIPENGILSILGNTLISHSNITQNSFNLFDGTDGDLGSNYTVRARTAYFSNGNRWAWKNANKSFIEGYVSGLPPMTLSMYQEVEGCGGIFTHPIKPMVCLIPDHAPFGEGPLGSHQNGSDTFQQDSHFYEIYPKFEPILEYRLGALQFECTTTNHSYSLLSMGLNNIVSNRGNTDLLNKQPISKQ